MCSAATGHDAVASASVDRQVAASSAVAPSSHPIIRPAFAVGTCCSSACALDEWTSQCSLFLQCSSSSDFRGSSACALFESSGYWHGGSSLADNRPLDGDIHRSCKRGNWIKPCNKNIENVTNLCGGSGTVLLTYAVSKRI